MAADRPTRPASPAEVASAARQVSGVPRVSSGHRPAAPPPAQAGPPPTAPAGPPPAPAGPPPERRAHANGHQFPPVSGPPEPPARRPPSPPAQFRPPTPPHREPPPGVPISDIDYAVVKMLRAKVSDEMAAELRDNANVSVEHRRALGERIVATVVRDYADQLMRSGIPFTTDQEAALLDAVASDLFGIGRLQQLLEDPTVVNIHILGCDHVRVEHTDGTLRAGPRLADSDAELVNMLQSLAMRAAATERSMSSTKPWVDLQLPDGSRLTALIQVSVRPTASIRRHTILDVTLEDLRDRYAMVDHLICDLLRAAMVAGCNIMVAGLAGAGKTTLLRALASEIPEGEAIVTLEESRELGLHTTGRHPWCISLEAREGHGQRGADGRPAGEVTIADLIPLTLRMSTQRVIVGEVRSREIVPMLQAMGTSRGSMCTIHARNPRAVMDRIVELALSHGKEMTSDLARRMAASAVDLIVYVTVEDETAIGGRVHRYVSEIVEIGGMSGDRLVTTTLFGPGPDGRAVPRHLPDRLREQLLRVGYDPRVLTDYIQAAAANRGSWAQPLQTLIGQHHQPGAFRHGDGPPPAARDGTGRR